MSTKAVSPTIVETHLQQDHSACGVGFVAAEDGVPTNAVLRNSLRALSAMEHRGGMAADGETSDGAGITIQVDQDFWKRKFVRRFGESQLLLDNGEFTEQGKRDVAVGNIFFPRDDRKKYKRCQQIFEEEFENAGYAISEREPPIQDHILGILAKKSHPRLYQYCVLQKEGVSSDHFDLDVYLAKRRIEKKIKNESLSGQGQNRFYICSLNRHFITFKSLSPAHKLAELCTDLRSGVIKTAYAIFHRRYATNTLPTWERAHPNQAGVAHNGEINSLITNVEMFKQRLEQVFINLYGEKYAHDLMDVIQEDGTDSAMLSEVVDFLLHAGFSPPAIKSLLVPEAVMPGSEMSDDVRKMYEFIDALIGPWDGPNAMIIAGRDMILIGGDRSGFRPIRLVRTKGKNGESGFLCAASEDGILQKIPNKDVIERGSLEPGQMLAANFKEGRIVRDTELKEQAARELEEKLGFKALLENVHNFDDVPATEQDYELSAPEKAEELTLRQRQGNHSQETIDYIDYMAETGKEPIGSMGDDAALTVVSTAYRTIQNFFQQRFAQVTNPPLDTIREKVVTSLKTHLGFFYDKDGKKTRNIVHRLDSPILNTASHNALREKLGEPNVAEIKCKFDVRGRPDQLKYMIDRLCDEAVGVAESGRHIILTDEHADEHHAPIPMLLIAGAINTHLSKLKIRSQTSIHVRTAEAYEAHDFAALTGLAGVDTINAYVAEETIAARYKANIYKFEDETSAYGRKTSLREFLALYADTGNAELDQKKKESLEKLRAKPGIQKFLESYPDLTLEELTKHSDIAVSTQFRTVMKQLDVEVHELFGKQSLDHVIENWKTAAQNGLLKIMGKMGVAHIASYRGGRLFEALGVSKEVIAMCFPGVPTPINGLSLAQIQEREVKRHKEVWATDPDMPLEHKGRYKFRDGAGQEPHVMTAELIEQFQDAVKENDFAAGYKKYKEYTATLLARTQKYRFSPRDWMGFKKSDKSIDISEVEDRDDIVERFFTGAMSRGSISQEAHETLAIAANRRNKKGRLRFKSNSGEGGEHPDRLGSDRRSRIKQVASARFGVDLDYLLDADEIQIKVAQGAKPGEGGELDGKKVNFEIAFLRHCKEGTTLISPAPLHDIYSIEDLEQLIYDLKQVNTKARLNVKLVASSGVDVIASGCAKAGADTVHVSGYNGGTGASPQGSISHAGMPWELFIAKINKTLTDQGFRKRLKISTDGGMRMGRDIVIAALLGAEEYGYGLQALIAEGCKLVRTCQNGECPFKIAGDKGEFIGTPEMINNMMDFVAEDVREILASLGLKSLDDAVGRTDLLEQVWGKHLGLDLSEAIPELEPGVEPQKCALKEGERNERVDPKDPHKITIDQKILRDHEEEIREKIRSGEIFQSDVYKITNEDRTFGARISGELRQGIIDEFGRDKKVEEDKVVLNLKGVAGQSLGMALMEGITVNLEGSANDGVGKSLSGGKIILRPDHESSIHDNSHENTILGNAALYGATAGKLYAAGKAGNRFAVRISGAEAVVEGAGAHACEYMTEGRVAILGNVGHNFGAGMSGGEAFIYDENNKLKKRTYDKSIKKKIHKLDDEAAKTRLKGMIQEHFKATGSLRAKSILDDWENAVHKFKHVQIESDAPKDTKPGDVAAPATPVSPQSSRALKIFEGVAGILAGVGSGAQNDNAPKAYSIRENKHPWRFGKQRRERQQAKAMVGGGENDALEIGL